MADALAGQSAPPDLGELARCAAQASSRDEASNALLAAPLNLLLDDLRRLQAVIAARPPT